MSNITPNVLRGGVSIQGSGNDLRYGEPSLSILSGNIEVSGSVAGSNTIESKNNTTISSNIIDGTTSISGSIFQVAATKEIGIINATNNVSNGTGDITIQSNNSGTSTSYTGIIDISTDATTTTTPLGGINLTTNALNGADINIGQPGNLTNVKGNLTVDGDLIVSGTTTTIDTETLTVKDNIIVCNSSTAEVVGVGNDAGLFVQRQQVENNVGNTNNGTGAGLTLSRNDIVTGGNPTFSGTVQSGSGTTITLAANDSNVNDFYNGGWIHITAGGTGPNQVRKVANTGGYNGLTKVLTIDTALTTALDNTSTYNIFTNKQYSGLIYREAVNSWELLSAANNPATGAIAAPTSYEDLTLRNINVTGVLTGPNIGVFTNTSVIIDENIDTPVTIPGMSNLAGNGLIFVSGNKTGDTSGCANAVFIFSKGIVAEVGQVNRLVSSRSVAGASPGNGGDGDIELDIVMDTSLGPRLKHVAALTTSNLVTYSIKFVQM